MSKNLEYVLEFTGAARKDIREIVLWYKNEQEVLEVRFLFSLKASVERVVQNPHVYQVSFNSIRSLLLKRFPTDFIILLAMIPLLH